MISISLICWLESWYESECNGDWEHSYGVKIGTIDNPGWSIQISLIETGLEFKAFNAVEIERDEGNWIHCRVQDGCFEGFGGPRNLEELIKTFKEWVEKH
ncbi:hypothetical protein D3C76_1591640 [compost metagenome]|uniref:immunity 53 family protein n=1 Tax=Paenibacillus sp. J53TS2 TaxID=2807197 RepID=UPI000FBCC26D|nr:immunity 53 family protein [Paenibacillus sp. J53TS2]GIP49366.1 hypothetical protein J53TS2_29570 [Paenibacillus sp. J53TS2]